MNPLLNLILGFPLGTILGVLLGTVLAHRLAIRRARDDRLASIWNAECLAFKAAFHDTLVDLCDIEEPYSVAKSMRLRFPAHQAAYVRFAPHVTGQARRDLDEVWKQYEDYHHQYDEQTIRFLGVNIPESERRKTVLGHINRLLSFAKET